MPAGTLAAVSVATGCICPNREKGAQMSLTNCTVSPSLPTRRRETSPHSRHAAIVCVVALACALLIPATAAAQGADVEIVHVVSDFDVLRFETPPELNPPFAETAGTVSEQIHLRVPGATLSGGSTVTLRVTFNKPIAVNVAALRQFDGTFNVSLQGNNVGSSGSLYGTAMSPPQLYLSGINARGAHTSQGSIGTGIPQFGGNAGTIYMLEMGASLSTAQLVLDSSNNAAISSVECRFEIPLTTAQGVTVNSTVFDSFKLIVYANVGFYTESPAVPALLSEHGDTQVGQDVFLAPVTTLPDGSTATVYMSFDQVLERGDTSVVASADAPELPPSGFKLTSPPVIYDITTTATFTGTVRVCLKWIEGQVINEAEVGLFHYEFNQWTDITDPASRDTLNNVVCGVASGFSPFTLFDVKYQFTGFFQPVDNAPTTNLLKAGAAVPVKFSLGRDAGLNILAPGYPRTQQVQCQTGALIAAIEETVTAGSSNLSYDAGTGRYTYVWKTDKAWSGNCRELQMRLTDGEIYTARFMFNK
jgi:hypothetical protein